MNTFEISESSLAHRVEKLLENELMNDSTQNIRHLAHELALHQIELENQNEELQKTQIELVQSSNKYQALYDFAPVGYITLDTKGFIVEANVTVANMFGFELNKLIKKPLLMFTASDDVIKIHALIRDAFSAKEIHRYEIKFKKKDETFFYAQIQSTVRTQDNNNERQLWLVIIDITERKKIEEEKNIAKEKAEESDKLKSAFLANMSHEIRTPLNSILGFSDFLNYDIDEAQRKQHIKIIQDNGKQLLSIINNIIDVSKIETGQMRIHLKPTCINALIHKLSNSFNLVANDKNINLINKTGLPDSKSTVEVDDVRLKQILTNLISNALNFTSEGSVEFGYQLKENRLEFYVKDSGIGIPPELHDVIFDRFRQAEIEHTKSFEGTGLGLAISKALVELLGGNIRIESEPGKGSVFYFDIPYRFVHKQHSFLPRIVKPQIHANSWKNKVLLIVEDHDLNYLYLFELLKSTGINIIRAKDGLEAIQQVEAKAKQIDLVLMDMKIPKLDGFETTKKIKEIRDDLPVIAQTAYAMQEDRQRAINAGCDSYITKPIERSQLMELMSEYLA